MARIHLSHFDPEEVAKAEVRLWRHYYNHQFARMTLQIFKVMNRQLKPGWFLGLKLAWHSGLATARYRLNRGNEPYEKVLTGLTRYYRLISDNCDRPFDHKLAARLELKWWDKHRYPNKYKETLAQTIADTFAVVYNVEPKKLEDYGRYRAEAAEMVSHESDSYHQKNDWALIEELLAKSWTSLHRVIQSMLKR